MNLVTLLIPYDGIGPEIEIGWRLNRLAWGKAEAARPILEHAFRTVGMSRVVADIDPRNLALVISIWEYHWGLRYLWGGNFAVIAGVTREGKQTPMCAVAIAPRLHWCIRVLRRAAAYGVAVRGEDRSRSLMIPLFALAEHVGSWRKPAW